MDNATKTAASNDNLNEPANPTNEVDLAETSEVKIKPPPDYLGKRQRDLNDRVDETVTKKARIDDLNVENKDSAVDEFYKIDVAAKLKNVDYIIDVLKTFDTLYVSRALKKCSWLYDDEYSDIVNPEYLQENIFPVTSVRVKRLILKTVAIKVRREDRAAIFFKYFMKIKMTDMALRSLLFTSEEFKLEVLKTENNPPFNEILRKNHRYSIFLIGHSFALLDAYMALVKHDLEKMMRKFIYFYRLDNNKYLDLYEKYLHDKYVAYYNCPKFDSKICDNLMKKYKNRVLNKPFFYYNRIQKEILMRNITQQDATIFIIALMPSTIKEFWDSKFDKSRAKDFLDFIPHSEMLDFLKKIYSDKYHDDGFEFHKHFYDQQYYNYMTAEQQEKWALEQVKSEKQVLGVGKDYLWYRFVNFKEAFEGIRKYVVINQAEIRADMLITLIKVKRSDRDLEKLFKYYFKRHVNEPPPQKITFLDEVLKNQNVFEFDEDCWEAFHTLLLSMELYNNEESGHKFRVSVENYKNVIVLYHIIKRKHMSPELMTFFMYNFNERSTHQYVQKMKDQKRFYALKEIKKKMQMRIRTSRGSTGIKLLRYLKKDKDLLDPEVETLKNALVNNQTIRALNMNKFLKKIKIYFPSNATEKFLSMFVEILSEKNISKKTLRVCMNAIFMLGNEDFKIKLMRKYVPEKIKIDYKLFERDHVNIQRAICQSASASLPAVPLPEMVPYVKGDYAKYCLSLFSKYIAALPISKCIDLVKCTLNAPVSIQKHAVNLAFKCYGADDFNDLLKGVWKKTKNVSLRSIIYKALYKRIINKNEKELHDTLIAFTLDLHDDDDKDIFTMSDVNVLPHDVLGKYTEAKWKAVGEFKDKEPNISRKVKLLRDMQRDIKYMDKQFVRGMIDKHLNIFFIENKLCAYYAKTEMTGVYQELWNLTVQFIVSDSIENSVEQNIELARYIVQQCVAKWNEFSSQNYSQRFIYQFMCSEFVEKLFKKCLQYYVYSESLIPLYEGIVDVLKTLPFYETYVQIWDIQLMICSLRVMMKKPTEQDDEEANKILATDFCAEIGKLITEYIDKKIYFTSFSERIARVIFKRVAELVVEEFYFDIVIIIVASGLLDFKIMETYLLSLQLLQGLPSNRKVIFSDLYKGIIDCVSKEPHPEIYHALLKLRSTDSYQ